MLQGNTLCVFCVCFFNTFGLFFLSTMFFPMVASLNRFCYWAAFTAGGEQAVDISLEEDSTWCCEVTAFIATVIIASCPDISTVSKYVVGNPRYQFFGGNIWVLLERKVFKRRSLCLSQIHIDWVYVWNVEHFIASMLTALLRREKGFQDGRQQTTGKEIF